MWEKSESEDEWEFKKESCKVVTITFLLKCDSECKNHENLHRSMFVIAVPVCGSIMIRCIIRAPNEVDTKWGS